MSYYSFGHATYICVWISSYPLSLPSVEYWHWLLLSIDFLQVNHAFCCMLFFCQSLFPPSLRLEKEYTRVKHKEAEDNEELRRLKTENRLLLQRIDELEKVCSFWTCTECAGGVHDRCCLSFFHDIVSRFKLICRFSFRGFWDNSSSFILSYMLYIAFVCIDYQGE